MKAFKNILFPMDFSKCSEAVFPWALQMAKKFDAKLHILFVARDILYLTAVDVMPDFLMNAVAEISRSAEEKLEAFCEKELADFPNYEAKVVIGDPGEEILKYADERVIDLIVMGTHGRKGIDRVLMGSVADLVIKNASVPVMTVNPFRPKVKYIHT
jgi:nucleotide-binding universal stress UspA family protein